MRIASFNVQNMRLRPGPPPVLSGARDGDAPGPRGTPDTDAADRRLTAQVIALTGADVIALQEVFDQATLDHFHDHWLRPLGGAPYPWRICRPGNDGRGLNVALMARVAPVRVRSHAALSPRDLGIGGQGTPVFRRDCLEVDLPGLTLFVCHFKAPWPDPARAWALRRAEALALRALIAARWPDPAAARWLVLGDLNEPACPGPAAIAPLTEGGFAVDLGRAAGWSFGDGRLRGRPDRMLASPALARANPRAHVRVLRAGISRATPDPVPRLRGVGWQRPHASDHAALVVDLPG